ncbi:hypothetical protein M758_2G210200 [Ceratodon purpureus]|nr:hypothetical protein M758_2G210200 [Ceratodon purpureus]
MATALGHGAGILPTRAGGVVSLRRSANDACKLRRAFGGDGVRGLKVVGAIRGSGRDVIQRDSVDQERESPSGALSDLVRQSATSSATRFPEVSLREGRWVKLICGASFEDVVDIRNLSLVYTLAGVDCIDCAADSAVVAAVLEGVTAAQLLARHLNVTVGRPWIMVSINDDDDPHFRKAEFDPALCPTDCPRPCERVCPAAAIAFKSSTDEERLQSSSLASTGHSNQHSNFQSDGVITERCYGCGRCLPICPLGLIHARTYVRDLRAVANLLSSNDIDAIEIHTGAGHLEAFHRVVGDLSDVLLSLKLIAVSVPDLGDRMIPALATMYESLRPVLKGLNLWQLDGRPMSGDIGAGATKAAVALAESVAASEGRPPGYLQLAGGTNSHTVDALERQGLFLTSDGNKAIVAGVAYGGYARKIVTKYLKKMESCHETWDFTDSAFNASGSSLLGIEHYPSLLHGALQEATALVAPFKGHVRRQ